MSSLNLDDQKQKVQQFASNAQDKLQGMSTKTKESMDNIRSQIMAYGNQIQEYLNKVNAQVTDYKFSVEKSGSGIAIEVAFKANITMKENSS
jgi:ElaB/YqjD/DUF883 family membrane-anchored ribosome-binding protein